MRAQASLEYLLVSLISLSMLTLSAAALLEIKDYSDSSAALLRFRHSSETLLDAMGSVCALGPGNSREVLLRSSISVESGDGGVRLRGAGSIARKLACDVVPEEGLEGTLIVENEKGRIRISVSWLRQKNL